MALYAYCLSDELSGERLAGVRGVAGMSPRLLICSGIAVVVSDFEGERVTVERPNVFAHERVVRRVLERLTPLPFRFGTLVEPDKLEDYVKANRTALMQNLERVRDAVEMSVKIIWDAGASRRLAAADVAERGGESDYENRAQGRGTAYLTARRRELLGDQLAKERAEELAEWLRGGLGEVASEVNIDVRPSEALVLRAAFLVRRASLADYRARLEEAQNERTGLRFLTSGPWPPYSFSHINP